MDTQEKMISEIQEMNSILKDIRIQMHNLEDSVKRGVQGAMLTAFGCFGGLVLLYELLHWIFSFFK